MFQTFVAHPPRSDYSKLILFNHFKIRELLRMSAQGVTVSNTRTSLQATPTNNSSETNHSTSLWDFNFTDTIPYQQFNATALPLTEQESVILNELIYCLIGIRGSYINAEQPNGLEPIKFKISEQIQVSLRDIVNQILPLASHYSQIQRFVEQSCQPACGQVLQALSSALRLLTNDYYVRFESMI